MVGQTGTEQRQQRPSDVDMRAKAQVCSSLEQSDRKVPFKFPKRLIGFKCTAQVTVRGEEINCLLDSGSQVTTIPQSLYKQHFADQEIKPLHDLLEVEGANGQSVPYFGYIEMTV